MAPLVTSPAARVRARIAHALLSEAHTDQHLGDITLRPHQLAAVERLRHLLHQHRGALLADDVGLGKTFVAIALLREARHPLVVAPAALREMWYRALGQAQTAARVLSYHALSCGYCPNGPYDLVVLDEAHHARNPSTLRYARLASLTATAPTLLLTATPIHNHSDDLAALLALFLGARAWQLDENQRAEFIVRRERHDVPNVSLPRLQPPAWLAVGDDAELLADITALPPPLPPNDGLDGGALVTWGLVRLWASSHGALMGALDRRIARATALETSLAVGHYPSRDTLAAWTLGDDAIQLSFPQMFFSPAYDTTPLLEVVTAHARGIERLRTRARDSAWTDAQRAARLRDIRSTHPGEKVIAFSQFTDTVSTLFALLRGDPGVALLTANGGHVAGGRLSRQETLAHFAPNALGASPPPDTQRIDLLLTTDILSEGTNLQDASVIVHLDLPWTPARLEQRVGRARRLGSPHQRVAVYAMSPPAAAEALLQVEERLLTKLRAAGRAVGVTGAILPHLDAGAAELDATAAQRHEALLRLLTRWHAESADLETTAAPVIAHVQTARHCVAALFREATGHHLAASVDQGPLADSFTHLLEAATLLDGAPDAMPGRTTTRLTRIAMELVQQWSARRASAIAGGAALPLHAPVRRDAIRRIATITARAPHHRRSTIAPLAERARRAVTMSFGIGAERVLQDLAASPMPDEAWLRALGTFADTQARAQQPAPDAPPVASGTASPTLAALLIGAPTMARSTPP